MKKMKTLAVISAAILVGSMSVSAFAAPTSTSNTKLQSASAKTLGAQKAKEIALKHAGLKAENVKFEKAQLEYDDHVAIYDVEFYTNETEYEYEINAVSGAVIESHKENKKVQSSTKPNVNDQTSNGQNTAIISTKAQEIALNHAGLKVENVVMEKVKLDTEDGVAVYEVEFHRNNKEYSYEINANSGVIVDFEVDND